MDLATELVPLPPPLPPNTIIHLLPNSSTPPLLLPPASGDDADRELPVPMEDESASDRGATGGRGRWQNIPPCVEVMKNYLGTILVAIVLLIYQSRSVSLLVTDPVPLYALVAFALLFWIIVSHLNNQDQPSDSDTTVGSRILYQAALVSAFLSISSPIILLLPPKSILRPKYWIVVTLGVLWFLIYSLCIFLHPKVVTAVAQIGARHGFLNLPPPLAEEV